MSAFLPFRRRLAPALLLAACSSLSHALSFDEALALAQARAPEIAARASEAAAADSLRRPAAELPDPRLVLGIENLPVSGPDRFDPGSDPMTMRRIGLMQEVPNAAKRAARAAAAAARAQAAHGELRAANVAVMRAAALAWLARDTAERQLAYSEALLEENRLFEAAVRARLSGGGPATEAVLPRQEAALIENLRDELRARREQAIAALRRWIGDAAEAPLAGAAPEWPIEYETLAHALHRHPELEVLEPRARALDAELAEARAELRPDWAVEFAYQNRGDDFGDMAMLQVAFDLPLFAASRQNPRITARSAERAAFEAEREAVRREHAAMLEADHAEYRRLGRALSRQRETLAPLAAEKAALALAAWRGGRGSLAELSSARRERIEADMKTIELEGARRQLAARLHYTSAESGETP